MKKAIIIAATTVVMGILAYAFKLHQYAARAICRINDLIFK